MTETIQASKLNLMDLKLKFGLELTEDDNFFPEWQEDLPELTDLEKQFMDDIKQEYRHLSQYPMPEALVKLVVLGPLLKWAGFYRPPFFITGEKQVEITSEDEETVVSGRLDLLVFIPDFWVLSIEAKKAQYSLEAGIPQVLAYMLGSPDEDKPVYGMVNNGPDFTFLKLTKQQGYKYGRSRSFALWNKNDLHEVLQILKRLGKLVTAN
jgi:hypothetical protein